MNRKILLIPCLALMLGGCDKVVSYLTPDPVSETEEPEKEQEEDTAKTNDQSLHPDEVTEYDRKAVTSLINQDLKEKYGKGNYVALKEEEIVFEKKNGIITARGNYTYSENGRRDTVAFEYQYEDKNREYVNMNAEAGDDVEPVETPKPDLSGQTPNRVYDFSCASGVQITTGHTGDGEVLVRIMDSEGKQVKEVVNKSGEFNDTANVELDGGQYQIWITATDGNWSLYYSSY